ncbi:unnamed protein product [Lepidochelys olivacea]
MEGSPVFQIAVQHWTHAGQFPINNGHLLQQEQRKCSIYLLSALTSSLGRQAQELRLENHENIQGSGADTQGGCQTLPDQNSSLLNPLCTGGNGYATGKASANEVLCLYLHFAEVLTHRKCEVKMCP